MSSDGEILDIDEAAVAALDARHAAAQRRIARLRAKRQRLEALELRALAELDDIALERHRLHGGDLGLHHRSVAAELALELRVSDMTVQRRIDRASRLVRDWPAWLSAFESGRIDTGHLRVLESAGEAVRQTELVSADQRAAYAEAMLEVADAMTPGRLARSARLEADRLLAEPLTLRHRAARADRAVWLTDEDDGMSALGIRLPAVQAHGIVDRLLCIARGAPEDDARTIPNIMADTAAEMLLTAPGTVTIPGSEHVRAEVRVTIPATTLIETGYLEGEAGVEPAVLNGSTPIDAETARVLAGQQTTWLRVFVQPFTGYPVGVDTYTPTAAQRRWVQLRDATCRFPVCDRASWRCDTDHTHAHADGGCTDQANLAQLCRRHHVLKHHQPTSPHAWRLRQVAPGVLEWTTPQGKAYIDRPMPVGPRARRPVFTEVGRDAAPAPPPF